MMRYGHLTRGTGRLLHEMWPKVPGSKKCVTFRPRISSFQWLLSMAHESPVMLLQESGLLPAVHGMNPTSRIRRRGFFPSW